MNFEGVVEIDCSRFGRKVKYHRRQPCVHRVWIFGIVESASQNSIPCGQQKHRNFYLIDTDTCIYPGSGIYLDSWASYMSLNEIGYVHFTVVHKTNFEQRYQNVDIGETVDCNTNRIEGTWNLCKDHFRRINGLNTTLFEQRIAYDKTIPIDNFV